MDREVVENVRRLFDSADPEALAELAHPELEIRPLVSWPGMDPAALRGPDGLRAYFDELDTAFGEVRYELQNLSEHGDALVADVLVHAEGRGSGASTAMPSFQLIRVEDGLVRSIEGYASREEAEAAVTR
jgi:ketosteroid isomerase-like protein